MEGSLDLINGVKEMIIDPNFGNAIVLFVVSFLNELVALFPYVLVLAGQLLFLEGSFSIALMAKLLVFVALPVGLGSSLGTLPVYVISYFGGKPAIRKFHKFLHFSWEDVEKVNQRFRGKWYDEIIFLLLRVIPVLPAFPVSIAAGILRMRFIPYFVLSTVGMILRMMITLLVIGMGMQSLSQL